MNAVKQQQLSLGYFVSQNDQRTLFINDIELRYIINKYLFCVGHGEIVVSSSKQSLAPDKLQLASTANS